MDLPRINHENIQDIFIKSFVFQKYYIKKKKLLRFDYPLFLFHKYYIKYKIRNNLNNFFILYRFHY